MTALFLVMIIAYLFIYLSIYLFIYYAQGSIKQHKTNTVN